MGIGGRERPGNRQRSDREAGKHSAHVGLLYAGGDCSPRNDRASSMLSRLARIEAAPVDLARCCPPPATRNVSPRWRAILVDSFPPNQVQRSVRWLQREAARRVVVGAQFAPRWHFPGVWSPDLL